MLPCQNQCASYHEGCHKTCAYWSAFQEHQKAQRQAKKAYLKYYGQLCADTLRQLTAMQVRYQPRSKTSPPETRRGRAVYLCFLPV